MFKIYIVAFIAFLLLSPKADADIITSLTLNEGYNSNIFNDSNKISDFYNTAGGGISIYPIIIESSPPPTILLVVKPLNAYTIPEINAYFGSIFK